LADKQFYEKAFILVNGERVLLAPWNQCYKGCVKRSESTEVLVTGGCGYIGSHVTRQLSEAGYRVTVLDNLSTGFRDSLLYSEELVVANVGDAHALDDLFRKHHFSTVLHFAASIVVPESVADPLSYYENNTVGTLCLLQACQRHGTERFVFSSTAAVYGEKDSAPVSEESPLEPASPYGRSKLMDEWILADVARATDLRYVVLRYFNVAGADPKGRIGQRFPKATHLIKVACEAATGQRGEVVIFGNDYPTPDGTAVRDYIHVEDLASAHLAGLKHLERGGKSLTLNCGYGRGHSVREVLDEVRRQGGDFRVTVGPRRAGDVASVIADATAIRQRLDWQPQFPSLSEIVRDALAFERKKFSKGR
jgi:UDP-glucose 4-epimerase